MRFLALLKPVFAGTAGARVLMAVAASTAVTAGVTAPMAQQAYEARSEQASALLAVDDPAAPSTTLPSSSDRAVSDQTGPAPTLPPTVPTTEPPSTTTPEDTIAPVTPQSTVLPPTTVGASTVPLTNAVPTTDAVPPVRPSVVPPATIPSTITPSSTVPPPTIALPTTTIRVTPTTTSAPTTTTTAAPTTTTTSTSTSTTSTSTTSTSTTSTSTSTSTTSTTVPTSNESIFLSTRPDRSNPALLHGRTVSGNVYVFVDRPKTDQVFFWIDDINMIGLPDETEFVDPFDLAKTARDGSAWPYDADGLGSGRHTLTVEITDNAGTVTVQTATFTVA